MFPDWYNKDAVIGWLKKSGYKGQTVFKRPDRQNFNICHTSRRDLYQPAWVVYQQ